jgi:tRNA nucleotidyltransferase (CCA-adding enzyme)
MAIPEGQLETWSHIGSIQQSAQTYDTIRNVLNDSASPYYAKDFSIFLQGSYGNATNVYKDSDVDVVICLNQTYYAETKALGEEARQTTITHSTQHHTSGATLGPMFLLGFKSSLGLR